VGCDSINKNYKNRITKFQSTHPRGVRPSMGLERPGTGLFQSTHPRGVRPGISKNCPRRPGGFNPRTRVGCDFDAIPPKGLSRKVSIHAPAWGATTQEIEKPLSPHGFNPRTRVGCDIKFYNHQLPIARFQSTHPRGVRQPPL